MPYPLDHSFPSIATQDGEAIGPLDETRISSFRGIMNLVRTILAFFAICALSACDTSPSEAPADVVKTKPGAAGKADGASAPAAWDCAASYYGTADGCDCGCGVIDPDCANASGSECDYEYCPANIDVDQSDNSQCEGEPPQDDTPDNDAWTCSDAFYGTNDGCDCGCSVLDPDCASLSSSECDYQYCDGSDGIVANDNTQCESPGDGDWGDDGDDEPRACAHETGCNSDSDCVAGSSCRTWGSSCLRCLSIFCTSNHNCPEGSRCAGYNGHNCVPWPS